MFKSIPPLSLSEPVLIDRRGKDSWYYLYWSELNFRAVSDISIAHSIFSNDTFFMLSKLLLA